MDMCIGKKVNKKNHNKWSCKKSKHEIQGMPFLLKKSAQGYLLYILYKNRSTHKFPKSSEHNIVPPPFHLDTLTSKLLPSAIQHHAKLAFVVLVVPNQLESISKLHLIIWLGHVHLGRGCHNPWSGLIICGKLLLDGRNQWRHPPICP